MDVEAEKQRLENEKAVVYAYLDHPITRKWVEDNADQQNAAIDLVLNQPVTNVETFLAREQALGHLRGLRRAKSLLDDDLEEIKDQLEKLRE